MKSLQHSLFSQNQEMTIAFFDKYDKENIKKSIINHLTENPSDTLEHCKEWSGENAYKNNLGSEILNFYSVNPKNNKPSLIITKGNNEYYKSLKT